MILTKKLRMFKSSSLANDDPGTFWCATRVYDGENFIRDHPDTDYISIVTHSTSHEKNIVYVCKTEERRCKPILEIIIDFPRSDNITFGEMLDPELGKAIDVMYYAVLKKAKEFEDKYGMKITDRFSERIKEMEQIRKTRLKEGKKITDLCYYV